MQHHERCPEEARLYEDQGKLLPVASRSLENLRKKLVSYGRKPEPGREVIKETFDNTEIKAADKSFS